MKTPQELAAKLARQWEHPDFRVALLTNGVEWPMRLPIGRPSPSIISDNWIQAKIHIDAWNAMKIGTVIRENIRYRAIGEAVQIPVYWEISSPDQWVQAAQKSQVSSEFSSLQQMVDASDPLFHTLLVRHRSLWRDKLLTEVLTALKLAITLEPGSAHGAPLRALSVEGIDSKFFERHRSLIIRLLDLRFDGEVTRQGLEVFLDAMQESDHWLLVADLDGSLLPFPQLRVRGSDLFQCNIPLQNLLIIENERCLHLLPRTLEGTVAILGTGGNLGWLAAKWVRHCRVAYWGDIDTWGLTLLARARAAVPSLTSLLMNRQTFDKYATRCATNEPVHAGAAPPLPLEAHEAELYLRLLSVEKGRLEQEFLDQQDVQTAVQEWLLSPAAAGSS